MKWEKKENVYPMLCIFIVFLVYQTSPSWEALIFTLKLDPHYILGFDLKNWNVGDDTQMW